VESIVSPLNTDFFNKERAGLGIFFQWNREDHHAIYVQASSFACSALQAEALALELAAQIGKLLQVQEPNFLTVSQILADALTKRDLKNHPGHWTIRPNLLQFINHTQGNQAGIFKIKRENNIVDHRNTHEAITSNTIGACALSCKGTTHPSDLCPVKAVISDLNVQFCTLQSVICQ
jgi:hypothetical protein